MDIDPIDMPYGEEITYVVVFVTTSSEEEGSKIAGALVEEETAACVNMIKGVRSIFKWKGKIEEETEVLMIIKTRVERLPELIARVKALHSYDVPEIIALPIVDGNPSYLQWIEEVT